MNYVQKVYSYSILSNPILSIKARRNYVLYQYSQVYPDNTTIKSNFTPEQRKTLFIFSFIKVRFMLTNLL